MGRFTWQSISFHSSEAEFEMFEIAQTFVSWTSYTTKCWRCTVTWEFKANEVTQDTLMKIGY